jgi:hypothetical protein
VLLRTRLQRYWRYAPSRKTQGFADDPEISFQLSLALVCNLCCEKYEVVSKVETPRHSRKSGNLLPIFND